MGFYSTTLEQEKPHQKTSDCAQKTESGKFFTSNRNRTYQIERNPLETQQEKLTTTRETASGVFFYKYRHYSAELGRWLGRDLIEEKGGVNLYGFVGNDPIGMWDKLGLRWAGGQLSTTNFNPGYNTAVNNPIYGPTTYYVGYTDPRFAAAAGVAHGYGGLDLALWNHAFTGGGADYDISGEASVEAAARLRWQHVSSANDSAYQAMAKTMICPEYPEFGGLAFNSMSHNDPLQTGGYTTGNFSLGGASTGYDGGFEATLTCKCNLATDKMEPLNLSITIKHKYYHYDQYADAADPFHIDSDNMAFQGSTQFASIGAWGTKHFIIYQWL